MPFTIYDEKSRKQIRPTHMNKTTRAHMVTPYVHAGRVFLPQSLGSDATNDFLTEHFQFPAGKHDDIVDTTVMALQKLIREGSSGIMEREVKSSVWGDEPEQGIVLEPADGTYDSSMAGASGRSLWRDYQ